MPSNHIIANLSSKEYISPHDFGDDPRIPVYEFTDDFFGSLVYLKRNKEQIELISQELGLQYAGKWHDIKLKVISEKETPNIYQAYVQDFENISQPVRQEWDRFLEEFYIEKFFKGLFSATSEIDEFEKRLDEYVDRF